MEILAIIGGAAILWWVGGIIIFCTLNIYVTPGTPWSVRWASAAVSGFVLPWIFLTSGNLPRGGVIAPQDTTPEQEREIRDYLAAHCPCPKCRAKRGE